MSIPSSGSSTWRSASLTSSFVGMPSSLEKPHFLAPLTREEVDPVDEADPVTARAHHERVCPRAVRMDGAAAEEAAVRAPRRAHDPPTVREPLGREPPARLPDPGRVRLLDSPARRRPQLGLQLTAETPERRGGHHCLARSAD